MPGRGRACSLLSHSPDEEEERKNKKKKKKNKKEKRSESEHGDIFKAAACNWISKACWRFNLRTKLLRRCGMMAPW